jgi:hypothetical protein
VLSICRAQDDERVAQQVSANLLKEESERQKEQETEDEVRSKIMVMDV